MSKQREALREKLNELCEGAENRREIERLVFDLWHSQQEAHRLRAQEGVNYVKDKERLGVLERELAETKQRVRQLEQQVQSRDFRNAQLVASKEEAERRLSHFTEPLIDLDALDLAVVTPIEAMNGRQVEVHLKSMAGDMRRTLTQVAHIAKSERLLDLARNLTDEQIHSLAHLGFSELHFLRTITGDRSCTPIGFIVNGERLVPGNDAHRRAKQMEQEGK